MRRIEGETLWATITFTVLVVIAIALIWVYV